MEGRSFAGNNGGGEVMKLPIGFRFRPTDEELLFHYLKRKALSLPLPAPVILDFDVFISDPWSLPGEARERRRFYFCKGKGGLGSNEGTNFSATECGFWKTNGKAKQIAASSCDGIGGNHFLGTRKLWVFYHRSKSGPLGCSKTSWVMHEFQLPKSTQNPDGQNQEWGVCRVFQRRRAPNKPLKSLAPHCSSSSSYAGSELPCYIDYRLEENSTDLGPPEPSSPEPSDGQVRLHSQAIH